MSDLGLILATYGFILLWVSPCVLAAGLVTRYWFSDEDGSE